MTVNMKRRFRKYLMRKYEEMTLKSQELALESIVNRLEEKDILNKEILDDIISELWKDGWKLSKILAHLDVMDLEDRT